MSKKKVSPKAKKRNAEPLIQAIEYSPMHPWQESCRGFMPLLLDFLEYVEDFNEHGTPLEFAATTYSIFDKKQADKLCDRIEFCCGYMEEAAYLLKKFNNMMDR